MDLETGARDGYFGHWESVVVAPITPDMSVIGGKAPKEKEGEK